MDVEYEIYVPVFDNEGAPYPEKLLQGFREKLIQKFGGLTDTRYTNKGIWKVGFVKVQDEIVVWRVLSLQEGAKDGFMQTLKAEMEEQLKQEKVMIVRRNVEVL